MAGQLKRLYHTQYPRLLGQTLKESIMHELKCMSLKWDSLPEEKEEKVESPLKQLHWKIIKHFFIVLIKMMKELQMQDDHEPIVDENEKIEVVYECFCKEQEKLKVEAREISNGDIKWADFNHMLKEIGVQLWDIGLSNTIDLQRAYWEFED